MAKKKEDNRELEVRTVKHEYSEKELKELAELVVAKRLDLDRLEGEKKKAATTFKEKIDTALHDMLIASQNHRDGYEYREVECEIVRSFDTDEVYYIRTDNGEQVDRRPMTATEKQMRLDDVETEK